MARQASARVACNSVLAFVAAGVLAAAWAGGRGPRGGVVFSLKRCFSRGGVDAV